MSDEAAIKLAAAIERLAAAIERGIQPPSMGTGIGVHVYHHNSPQLSPGAASYAGPGGYGGSAQ